MIKKYRIYINVEKHKDIYECLEGIPRPLRGEFIRTAIRLLMNNTDTMTAIKINPIQKTHTAISQESFLDVFG